MQQWVAIMSATEPNISSVLLSGTKYLCNGVYKVGLIMHRPGVITRLPEVTQVRVDSACMAG
jgi:hypothetical protein